MRRFIPAFFVFCLLIVAGTGAQAAPQGPSDLKLGPPEGMKATKNLVDFPHARHTDAKLDCVTCHHTWDGTSDIKGCSVPGCHDQPGKKEATSYYTAFHSKRNDRSCVGCHKIVKKGGNKAVPVSCKSCHPK